MPFRKEHAQEDRRCLIRLADGELVHHPLPPINMIVMPKVGTKTALIRWLDRLGYTIVEIHMHLGIKYQMVRNITTNEPKRAAREDLPELVVEYKPDNGELADALDGALDDSLMAGRRERKKAEKELRRQNGEETDEADDS